MSQIELAAPVAAAQVAALIPAYLERRHIAQVVERTLPFVGAVVVIDDGSRDGTFERAEKAGATVLRHDRNRGKGAALKTGMRHLLDSNFTYFALLDADGQHLPEEIERFIAEANTSSAGLILGSRMENLAEMPTVRRWTNQTMSRLISHVCGQKVPDSQCGFRMVHREVAPLLFCPTNAYEYETEMLFIVARAGYRIRSVPVSTVYADETSKIRPVRDAIRFGKLLARYWK